MANQIIITSTYSRMKITYLDKDGITTHNCVQRYDELELIHVEKSMGFTWFKFSEPILVVMQKPTADYFTWIEKQSSCVSQPLCTSTPRAASPTDIIWLESSRSPPPKIVRKPREPIKFLILPNAPQLARELRLIDQLCVFRIPLMDTTLPVVKSNYNDTTLYIKFADKTIESTNARLLGACDIPAHKQIAVCVEVYGYCVSVCSGVGTLRCKIREWKIYDNNLVCQRV